MWTVINFGISVRKPRSLSSVFVIRYLESTVMRDSRGGIRGPEPPENHKHIGFLSNTGPDPLKNHKATKPVFDVWPSSARQRNAI